MPSVSLTSLVLSSRGNLCAYHPTPNQWVGIVFVKADPWPPVLILNWVMPEYHNCKDLNSLRDSLGFTLQ
jgi:hypothetical protein